MQGDRPRSAAVALALEVRQNIRVADFEHVEEILKSEFRLTEGFLRKFLWVLAGKDPIERGKILILLLRCGVPLDMSKILWWENMKDVNVLQEFLNHGWDVDTHSDIGTTPLNDASFGNDMGLLHWLLERGADPNVEQHQTDVYIRAYQSPTANANSSANSLPLDLLLWNGAKIDSVSLFMVMMSDSYLCPKPEADLKRELENMQYLIDNGADINAVGHPTDGLSTKYYSESPLHCAVGLRCEEYVRFLLNHGANRENERFGEFTPAALALKLKYSEIYELISNWSSSAT